MGIAENIDALLIMHDLKPESLARIADVSSATVSRWRSGKIETIRPKTIDRICEALDLTSDDILSSTTGLAVQQRNILQGLPRHAIQPVDGERATVPLLGTVHAGEAEEPYILEEAIEIPSSIYRRHKDAYLLRVIGDCMNKVITDHDYVLVDPSIQAQNGSIAVVSIDGGEHVMRRVFHGANNLILSPDSWNDENKDIIIEHESGREVIFHGVVVWHQAKSEME